MAPILPGTVEDEGKITSALGNYSSTLPLEFIAADIDWPPPAVSALWPHAEVDNWRIKRGREVCRTFPTRSESYHLAGIHRLVAAIASY